MQHKNMHTGFDVVEMSSLHHSYQDSSILHDSQHEFDKTFTKCSVVTHI